ncbi:MAG: M14 family metallocarboxypeptidase [Gammaproteobacteria bacterium]|nr:M14 family metallocarboxypeptidase [Gammaproteobacteria bacterium]
MKQSSNYPIGTSGNPWQQQHQATWLSNQKVKRSYQADVIAKLSTLPDNFELIQYATLAYQERDYPLFVVKSGDWQANKPTILVTGGVHGYETSGILGAISFIKTAAPRYAQYFNIVVAPCVSPWGYETINRWNPQAVDPNRSFITDSPAPEAAAIMQYIASLNVDLISHIDLHETTNTDNSEFRPALAARDGSEHVNWNIPDGFYLVGDTKNPVADFQQAIIAAVQKVTHIAPADHNGQLIGVDTSQIGVINYATAALGLCTGFSNSRYNTTTEVYPDSPQVNEQQCIAAQVAAITGGLNFIIEQLELA